jgi:signal transduction histidine kinase
MTFRSFHLFDSLKLGTLLLLGTLLFVLGTPSQQASLGAYLAFFGIILLQSVEILYQFRPYEVTNKAQSTIVLRLSIALQLILASVLVVLTGGMGSIYELIYFLPIISAASKLPGREVMVAVGAAALAILGFIITAEQVPSSISRVKEFQDAVTAIVYFIIGGTLIYLFAKDEREQRLHYQTMAAKLADTNSELMVVQAELTERLTQLAQMEERIQRIGQFAALGELAGQVAHEVRNPLGIIKGAAEMLATRLTDVSTLRHVAVLLEEVERVNKVVEGILRLGRPLRIQTTSLVFQDLLQAVVNATIAASPERRSSIRLNLLPTSLILSGDWELLHIAFSNLIRNALQATPPQGMVSVTAHTPDDGATLVIEDTGIGLSPDDLKRLGEPFFSKREGGVGLGFALARRIIAEHGGSVNVTSALGQGTRLAVHLPIHRQQKGRRAVANLNGVAEKGEFKWQPS